MVLPASRFTELNTWRGPTRSNSSTGGTRTAVMRQVDCGLFRSRDKRLGILPAHCFMFGNRRHSDWPKVSELWRKLTHQPSLAFRRNAPFRLPHRLVVVFRFPG